jgi:membrane protein implicated in regulation of membrane protease activity
MGVMDIDPAWYWLIAAGLLAITELAVPGVFLVWLAGAALLTGLVTILTGIALPAQLVLFGASSIAMVLLGRQVYARMDHRTTDPLLNDRGARLIGREVTVAAPIVNGEGRVKVGDGIWNANGPDAAEGTRVRITGTRGSCLLVTPVIEMLPDPDATR